MNDERLWAPWRLEYVAGGVVLPLPEPENWRSGADAGCFLCRDAATYVAGSNVDRQLLVVERAAHTQVVLNRFPYNNGHLLVAPLRHVADLTEMSADENNECVEMLARLTRIYRQQLNAEGFNVGLNLGRAAGAGLPGHLHWHLVPRWAGDTNFMASLAGIRVIPQSLESLWELLTAALDAEKS